MAEKVNMVKTLIYNIVLLSHLHAALGQASPPLNCTDPEAIPGHVYTHPKIDPCQVGHYSWSKTRTCLAEGKWNQEKPHCSRVWCGKPGNYENPLISKFTGRHHADYVTYSCKPGTAHLNGDLTRTCQAPQATNGTDGTWNGTAPTCYTTSRTNSPSTSATLSLATSATTWPWDSSTAHPIVPDSITTSNDVRGTLEPPSAPSALIIGVSVAAALLCLLLGVSLTLLFKHRRTIRLQKQQKSDLHAPSSSTTVNQSSTNQAYTPGSFTNRTISYQHYDEVTESDEITVYLKVVSEQHTENTVRSNIQALETAQNQTPKPASNLGYESLQQGVTNASVQGYSEFKNLSSPTDREKPDVLLDLSNQGNNYFVTSSHASSSGYEKSLRQPKPQLHNAANSKDSHDKKTTNLVVSTSATNQQTVATVAGCHSLSRGDRGSEMPQLKQDHVPPQSPLYTKLEPDYE